MQKLSGVVITYNEEAKIRRCLGSLCAVCDEIVVVDSGSTDRTVEICRKFTDLVHTRPWRGYRDQKQYATEQAAHEWVLSLDADEEVGPRLQAEVLGWKERSCSVTEGYFIPRIAFFMGRWIRHTTWYPDRQLRLFKSTSGSWEGGRIHEGFKVRGETGNFTGHIRHYTYSSVSEYLEQLERFSSLAAQDYYDKGRRAGIRNLLMDPSLIFLKNYVIRRGFLDGIPGLVVSILAATSTFFKYLKLYEIQNSTSQNRS